MRSTTTRPGQHRGFVDVSTWTGRRAFQWRGPLDLARAARFALGVGDRADGLRRTSAPNNDAVLLVGNFGDGHINAFDASTGGFLGELKDPDGEPIQIDGLWALKVGNGGAGATPTPCISPPVCLASPRPVRLADDRRPRIAGGRSRGADDPGRLGRRPVEPADPPG